jgi:hypothetical protein
VQKKLHEIMSNNRVSNSFITKSQSLSNMVPSSAQGMREDDKNNKENKTGSGAALTIASSAVASP